MSLTWGLHRSRPDGTVIDEPGPLWPTAPVPGGGGGPVPGPEGWAEPAGPVERPQVGGPAGESPWAAPPGSVAEGEAEPNEGLGDDDTALGPVVHRRTQWLRGSTFRSRVSLLVAVAVGISVTLAATCSYIAVRHELDNQVNGNLQNALQQRPPAEPGFGGGLNPQPFELFAFRTKDQVEVIGVGQTGKETVASVQPSTDQLVLGDTFFKLTPQAQAIFNDPSSTNVIFQTLTGSDGNLYRVAIFNPTAGAKVTVMIGYPLANTDHTLAFLRLLLLLVVLGGIALALALGWAVGKATMRPVENLTLAAEHVADTQDLSATIDESGNDELARLAHSFNAMLGALAASRQQQAHLVSDAGHELRTPLTSLRTNIEVLMRNRNLAGEDRDALLADVDAQVQELSTLVGDLVDLAREDEKPQAQPEQVCFEDVVSRAVERARRRAPSLHFDVSLAPGNITAQPALLERAVMNILDNAAKWSPSGGTVTVRLTNDGPWQLTVADEGPGISAEDLPHIFERFYRAASARSLPGSGLGLAIVQRVVRSHDGTVTVAAGPMGGTTVTITLPAPPAES